MFIDKHWLVWLRWGFILFVPTVAAGLGLIAAKRSPKYALVAAVFPFLVAGVELILRNFEYSPIVILLTACFIPLSLPTGTGSRLVFSLVLTMGFTALWVLRMIIVEKRLRLAPSPVNFPLIGFMIVTVISLGWSNLVRDPEVSIWRSFPYVQIASTVMMLMLPMALFMTANFIRQERGLKLLVTIMLIAGVLGLFRQYRNIRIPVNDNGLYTMWIICLSTGLALFNRQLSRWQRGLLFTLAGAWVWWGIRLNITWLAGWVPGVIGVSVLTFLRSKKWTAILVIAVAIFISVNAGYIFNTVYQSERQVSGITRLAAWEVNWRITGQHLLLGTGPAGYTAYYMSYFPLEGTATHNNYIDIISQTGVIGLIFCVWFFLSLVWYGYRLTLRLRGRGDFLEGLTNAALAGTVGCIFMMALGDWLFPFAYTQSIAGFDYAVYNWIFMGTLLAIDYLTKEQADTHA